MSKYMKEFLQASSNREISNIVTKMDFCIIEQEEEIKELKQQLAEKEKVIEFMATQLMPHQKSMSEICACYDRKRENEKDTLKEYTKQLEKEIDILSRNQIQNLSRDKQIRHQICEEIREKSFRGCIGLNEDGTNYLHYVISPSDLDQIEKGE